MAKQTGGMSEEVLLPILRLCSRNRLLESTKTNDVCQVNFDSTVDRNRYFSKASQTCYKYSLRLSKVR